MASNPKLIVLSEQLRGTTFDLSRDTYSIGRSDDRDIPIIDPTVSGLHATLGRNPDGSYTVKDNKSTNGTRINGVLITDQKLINSDILQIGGIEMMYDCDDETPSQHVTTKTQIEIKENKVKPNKVTNLNPTTSGRPQANNPKFTLAFKLAIGALVIVVLVLGFFLVMKIVGR